MGEKVYKTQNKYFIIRLLLIIIINSNGKCKLSSKKPNFVLFLRELEHYVNLISKSSNKGRKLSTYGALNISDQVFIISVVLYIWVLFCLLLYVPYSLHFGSSFTTTSLPELMCQSFHLIGGYKLDMSTVLRRLFWKCNITDYKFHYYYILNSLLFLLLIKLI